MPVAAGLDDDLVGEATGQREASAAVLHRRTRHSPATGVGHRDRGVALVGQGGRELHDALTRPVGVRVLDGVGRELAHGVDESDDVLVTAFRSSSHSRSAARATASDAGTAGRVISTE